MPVEQVTEIGRDLFYTALLVALPALAVSFVIGLVVSIFQTITSIQDQTLSFVPRVLLTGLVIVFTLSFSMTLAVEFTQRMFVRATEAAK
jgi:flagellar biosynthetic protein FliQ